MVTIAAPFVGLGPASAGVGISPVPDFPSQVHPPRGPLRGLGGVGLVEPVPADDDRRGHDDATTPVFDATPVAPASPVVGRDCYGSVVDRHRRPTEPVNDADPAEPAAFDRRRPWRFGGR